MKWEDSLDVRKLIKVGKDGKSIFLGSKYNMSREIEKFREKFKKINKAYEVVVFGASGGDWLVDFTEEFKDRSIVFVEPLEELKLELRKKIDKLNVNISALSLDSDDFYEDFKKSIDKRFIEFVVFSNYDLTFPREVYDLKKMLHDVVLDKTINENTRLKFSKDWFVNYLSNLPYILKNDTINNYKNIYHGKPAIIVSAGPSLEKNIKLLKGNEDKFIIITGIRTLATLKKEGINCDFACVIDGSDAMYRVSKGALDYETPLFHSEGVNKNILREYKGSKIYFTSPTFYTLNKTLDIDGTDLLFQAGSVAHSCTAIAHYLGCNPIVFIGQDLAYTNNQIHAKNAIIEGEELKMDQYDILVKDIYGNDIPTSYSLDSFRKSFENLINDYNDVMYINATEGGANIEGTEVKTLAEVINNFSNKISKDSVTSTIPCKNDEMINLVLKNLNKNLNKLKKIRKFAKEAVFENENLLDNYLKNSNSYKKSLNRLDYIDKKFHESYIELYLMNTLFAPIIKEIDVAFYDKKLESLKNEEVEQIKFVAEQGKSLYENIDETIEFAVPYLEEAIKELEELVYEL